MMFSVVGHRVAVAWWRRKSRMLLGPIGPVPCPSVIECFFAFESSARRASEKDDDLSGFVVRDAGKVATRW